MRRRTQVMWAVALLVLGVAAALGYGYGAATGAFGSADRSQNVARNEALLRQVPVYPGARYLTTWTHESKEDNGWPEGLGPITSYSTTHVYALDNAPPAPTVIQCIGRAWLAAVDSMAAPATEMATTSTRPSAAEVAASSLGPPTTVC